MNNVYFLDCAPNLNILLCSHYMNLLRHFKQEISWNTEYFEI